MEGVADERREEEEEAGGHRDPAVLGGVAEEGGEEEEGANCSKTMEQWSGICAAPTPQSYFLSQPNVSRTFIQFLNRSLITVLDISG